MSVLTSTNNQQNLPRYFARVFDLVGKLNSGRVDFILPDGRRFRAEGSKPGPVAEVTINNPDVFARLVREGDLGFCDAYLDGRRLWILFMQTMMICMMVFQEWP